MSAISTISELLILSQCQYRIYDLGRKVEKISKSDFDKLEQNALPFPTPLQGHAHLAICFWQKLSPEPYLWFVKLPLDERGLINQGARNHFIAIIIEALGSDLSANPNEKQQELLEANPYLFTPSQYKLAMLNSLISVELKKPVSQYYQDFVSYLDSGDLTQWHNIGVQGITEFAARINEPGNSQKLTKPLLQLPEQVLTPLCGALENVTLPVTLIEPILSKLEQLNKETSLFPLLLRSLASSTSQQNVQKYITTLINSQSLNDEMMITLAGRNWQVLNNSSICLAYLEHLANEHQSLFNAIFKDLVAIPKIRPILFQCMRDPERSEALSKAIGQLFS